LDCKVAEDFGAKKFPGGWSAWLRHLYLPVASGAFDTRASKSSKGVTDEQYVFLNGLGNSAKPLAWRSPAIFGCKQITTRLGSCKFAGLKIIFIPNHAYTSRQVFWG
jgi:hypothetical protein